MNCLDDDLVPSLETPLPNATAKEHSLDSPKMSDPGTFRSHWAVNNIPHESELDDIEENGSDASLEMQSDWGMTDLDEIYLRMFSRHVKNLHGHEDNKYTFEDERYALPVKAKGKEKAVGMFENHWRLENSFTGILDGETETLCEYGSIGDPDEERLNDALDECQILEYTPCHSSFDSETARSSLLEAYFGLSGPKSSKNSAEFVAGPSRITLDDLQRDSMLRRGHW